MGCKCCECLQPILFCPFQNLHTKGLTKLLFEKILHHFFAFIRTD